jgi:hypothetical protein
LVGSIYISEKMFSAISSYTPLSSTVPHEFGHQFMSDRYSDRLPDIPGDKSHAGFCYNPSSTDAWVEGFASFFASMVRRDYFNKEKYWNLPNGNAFINLETNHKALDYEEIAAAGILLDLVDQAGDYPHNSDGDGISVSLEELWKVLIIPVRNHVIRDMVDLYDGLKAGGIGQDDPHQNGLTALDEVFIAHGFYEHMDDDPAYNPGEKIGYTTHK